MLLCGTINPRTFVEVSSNK